MRDLLLGVEDFDILASVPVSYFYCRENNASELQVSIINGVCLKKIVCAQGNTEVICMGEIFEH